MKKIIFIVLFFISAIGFATHNRAGEISYERVDPKTQVIGGVSVPLFRYKITIITYTDDGPQIADRCADTVFFGDGQSGVAPRTNVGLTNCACSPSCGIIIVSDVNYRVKKNIYVLYHTYAGAGSYKIQMNDPNRNAGVYNIPNSDQQPFYLEALLVISNFSGANTSPEFYNAPIDRACNKQCFYHNPAAYDVDGDSLSFEITTSRGFNGQTVPGYFFPDAGPNGNYGINATTGLLSWCSPQLNGQYNVAFLVKEWRKNTSGFYQLIGYVLRDMQVIVVQCANNQPPVVTVPADTCVEAGTFISKILEVTDRPTTLPINNVTITGAGGAFTSLSPNAVFTSSTFNITPYIVKFSWQTSCDHIRKQPYQTVFKAQDQGPTSPLVSFSTYNVRVIPPAVKNVSATPIGSTIKITWVKPNCDPAANPIVGYKIYRKNDCTTFTYSPCSPGVDPATGYSQIDQTSSATFSLSDDNNGNGLVVGQNYSYLVVAIYRDGSESYASSPVCAKLKRDIPIILNADVRATSTNTGQIFVRWSKPLTNLGNLDTNSFIGPYQYVLKHRLGRSGNFNAIQTITSPYFLNLDTTFLHTNINTVDSTAFYTVSFIAGTATVGSAPLASSVYLKAIPGDRQISLSWQSSTPWNNYKYTIQRLSPGSSSYSTIATTTVNSYTDANGVVNKYGYCYKVLSEGRYSDPTISKPLLNFSQEVCAVAKDLIPPCTPTLSIDADCPKGYVTIKWNNVRNICSDDVLSYVLFYKSLVADKYTKGDTIANTNFSRTIDDTLLIPGCYAIQSVDSSGNASVLSPDFCIDNCPEFELPNIFSPNDDKVNDFYKAIKVRRIKEINLVIFDRWGNLVYKTSDPYFQWDGTSLQTKNIVSEGTFFYFCDVFESRLTGIRTRTIKGYLQMVR